MGSREVRHELTMGFLCLAGGIAPGMDTAARSVARSGDDAFNWMMANYFEPMKNQNKKVTRDFTLQWQQAMLETRTIAEITAVSMKQSMDTSVNSIVGNFKIMRERSKTVFGQMGQDFIRLFVQTVLKALASRFILAALNLISGGSFGGLTQAQGLFGQFTGC